MYIPEKIDVDGTEYMVEDLPEGVAEFVELSIATHVAAKGL